ncbi:MAG TPA: dihydrofolate reductase [Steroidobacteraceae bacterium]|nr:dihydrofolate reductase [Steroidobacteraceae bacterium]
MNQPIITLVVAAADNGTIGRDNQLPWHLPDDLKRFKQLTLGKPIVMGRKTFESIGKPLPGRQNIVVTRDANYRRDGVTVAHDVDAAARAAGDATEIMIIGGAELFRLFLPRAGRVHLTRVHGDVAGDIKWPDLDTDIWRVVASESHPADERHAWPMTFEVWEKN